MFDWLQYVTDYLVYDLLELEKSDNFSNVLHFFIYDSIKIFVLLFIIINLMGFINSYFPVYRVKDYLSRKKLYGLEYLVSSLFGVVTPFCSCSSVPLFIGFVKGGIPLGVTFSFLVTSPLVNEVSIGLFVGMFGLKTTLIYIVSGVAVGVLSGVLLQKLHLENLLSPWVLDILKKNQGSQQAYIEKISVKVRLKTSFRESLGILRGISIYVLVGIGVGALLHGYIPDGFFEVYLTKNKLLEVPIAAILAVPFYANASGVLPIVQVLIDKGVSFGTAVTFMMGVVGLSLPEAMLLKKVMTLKLIFVFFTTVTMCVILLGYFFNIIF